MVIRSTRTTALLLLLSGGFWGLGASAAAAADPTPTPTPAAAVIQYEGTGTVTDPANTFTYPVTWTVDCTSAPCTITGALVETTTGRTFLLTGGIHQPFVGGTGTYSYPESGDKCADTWLGAYSITIKAAGTQMTSEFDLPSGGVADCGSSTVAYDGSHVSITSRVTSGDPCHIFATCAVAPTAAPTAAASGGAVPQSTTLRSPSTLSTLPTATSTLSLQNAIWAAVMTTVLVILIALPSQLINTAVEHGAGRWEAWRRRARPVEAPASTSSGTGWPAAAGGVLLASVISSFVDPSFGFNSVSLRVFASILVSFLLDAVAGWFIVIWLVRRSIPQAKAGFKFVPATLAIVAAAVLFSRLTGFQPGIIFGLVAGVAFSAIAGTADKARVALLPLAYSFGAAVVGWLGYSALTALTGPHPDAVTLFAKETLSAMAIGGIAALPITLVPLRGLSGYAIFTWNRWVWGASYSVGLFGFFFVLMPFPFSWAAVSLNIWVWVAIYLAYAVVGVLGWLVVVRPWRRETGEAPEIETSEVETSEVEASR